MIKSIYDILDAYALDVVRAAKNKNFFETMPTVPLHDELLKAILSLVAARMELTNTYMELDSALIADASIKFLKKHGCDVQSDPNPHVNPHLFQNIEELKEALTELNKGVGHKLFEELRRLEDDPICHYASDACDVLKQELYNEIDLPHARYRKLFDALVNSCNVIWLRTGHADEFEYRVRERTESLMADFLIDSCGVEERVDAQQRITAMHLFQLDEGYGLEEEGEMQPKLCNALDTLLHKKYPEEAYKLEEYEKPDAFTRFLAKRIGTVFPSLKKYANFIADHIPRYDNVAAYRQGDGMGECLKAIAELRASPQTDDALKKILGETEFIRNIGTVVRLAHEDWDKEQGRGESGASR